MDNERFKSMDPYILLSMVNMKLRDFFSSLDALCEDWDIEKKPLEDKLESVGYIITVI